MNDEPQIHGKKRAQSLLDSASDCCQVNCMTKMVEAGELAAHLMEFLADVKAGHEVLVTSGQEPIARLVSPHLLRDPRPRSVLGLPSLSGRWIGEAIVRSGDLADEMFARE